MTQENQGQTTGNQPKLELIEPGKDYTHIRSGVKTRVQGVTVAGEVYWKATDGRKLDDEPEGYMPLKNFAQEFKKAA